MVRKYIKARSAADALRRERQFQVDDIWLDDDSKKANLETSTGQEMGFRLKTKKRNQMARGGKREGSGRKPGVSQSHDSTSAGHDSTCRRRDSSLISSPGIARARRYRTIFHS